MYQCTTCGARFETPVVVTVQRAGEPSFDIETCPECENDCLEDLWDCEQE